MFWFISTIVKRLWVRCFDTNDGSWPLAHAEGIMVHSVCAAIGPPAVPGRPLCSGDYLRAS